MAATPGAIHTPYSPHTNHGSSAAAAAAAAAAAGFGTPLSYMSAPPTAGTVTNLFYSLDRVSSQCSV